MYRTIDNNAAHLTFEMDYNDFSRQEDDTIRETNQWTGFYTRLMAECRELGIKPWGSGRGAPMAWAADRYRLWKAEQERSEEGWADEPSEDLAEFAHEGFQIIEIPETHDEDYVHICRREVERIGVGTYRRAYRRGDLEKTFSVPPYCEAQVVQRDRYGNVTGWRVEAL